MKWSTILTLALVVGLAGAGGALWFVRCRNVSDVEKGRRLAMELGCFNCHGEGGAQGIPNPGSEEKEVPAWTGRTYMMYIEDKSEKELREWILYGEPRGRPEPEEAIGHSGGEDGHEHDEKMLIRMPAYGDVLSERQLDRLVAYFRSVSGMDEPEKGTPGYEGYEEAAEHGCFGCHGPMGNGTPGNPGSLTGYIPSWSGGDFNDLVRSDDELRKWILDGKIERFEENPFARFFLRRQKIEMPAYKDILNEGEVESIIAYIRWLRSAPAK